MANPKSPLKFLSQNLAITEFNPTKSIEIHVCLINSAACT